MVDKKISKTHIAYEMIRQYITDTRMMPGTSLVETELAQRFNLSRTPIREAMKLLQADGLIGIIQNKGAHIKFFSNKDIKISYEVAEAIEGAIAKDICEKIDSGQIDHSYLGTLRDILEQMDAALAISDYKSWAAGDERFHNLLYSTCENPYFNKLLGNIYIQVSSVLWHYTIIYLDKRISQNEHWKIYQAIFENKPEEARLAAQRHRERIRKSIDDEPGIFSD